MAESPVTTGSNDEWETQRVAAWVRPPSTREEDENVDFEGRRDPALAEWNYGAWLFTRETIAFEVQQHSYRRVAVQFPDSLLSV